MTGFCATGDQLRTHFKLRSCGITSCAPSGQPLLLPRTPRSAGNRRCILSPARLKPMWLPAQKAPKPVMCTDASAASTRTTVSRRPRQRSRLDGGYGPMKTASTVVTIIHTPEPRPKPCNGCGLERGGEHSRTDSRDERAHDNVHNHRQDDASDDRAHDRRGRDARADPGGERRRVAASGHSRAVSRLVPRNRDA